MRMAAEEHDGGRAPSVNPTEGDHPLDEVAKSLATGTVSRRQAVRWMGGALLGSVLAIVPGVEAFAAPKPAKGRCPTGFVNCRGTCVKTQSNSSHCGGCFIQCSQNETCCGGQCSDLCSDSSNCGFCGNACTGGRVCQGCGCSCPSRTVECGDACVSEACPEGLVLNPSTCQCESDCPSGTIECGRRCVPNLCPQGQAFNPSACQCESCPPGTSICHGEPVGLNACCPLEGHIACCNVRILDARTGGTADLGTAGLGIGCINTSCPGGCVIMATDPGDLLGSNAGTCDGGCNFTCLTDSGGLGCLRFNPDNTLVIPYQCDPL